MLSGKRLPFLKSKPRQPSGWRGFYFSQCDGYSERPKPFSANVFDALQKYLQSVNVFHFV
jgi:hypothetical protein